MVRGMAMMLLGAAIAGCGGGSDHGMTSTVSARASTPTVPGGAACDLGDVVVMGCDGQPHADTIVRYTMPDGDVITCWEGQMTIEPVTLSCPAGTACAVFQTSGVRAGVCD